MTHATSMFSSLLTHLGCAKLMVAGLGHVHWRRSIYVGGSQKCGMCRARGTEGLPRGRKSCIDGVLVHAALRGGLGPRLKCTSPKVVSSWLPLLSRVAERFCGVRCWRVRGMHELEALTGRHGLEASAGLRVRERLCWRGPFPSLPSCRACAGVCHRLQQSIWRQSSHGLL